MHRPLPLFLSRCRHAELPFQLFCVASEEGEIHSRWEERNTSSLTIWLTAVSHARKSDPPHPTLPALNPPTLSWKSRSVSHTSRVTSRIKLERRAEKQEIHRDIRRMRGGQAVGGLGEKWSKEQERKRGQHRSTRRRQEVQFSKGVTKSEEESRPVRRKSESHVRNWGRLRLTSNLSNLHFVVCYYISFNFHLRW